MQALDRKAIKDALDRKDFSRARRTLRPLVLADPTQLVGDDLTWARQKLALATYKDPELQTEDALEEALRLLAMEDLETTEEAETLNLAGAVHKRLWEVTGDQHALRRSRALYARALAAGRARDALDDWTYSAINLAYVLDLMAREESVDEGEEYTKRAEELRAQADREREAVCAQRDRLLGGADASPPWWRTATLAEACFGLGQSEKTRDLLREGLARATPPDWERESTARQLVALAQLRYLGEDAREQAMDALSPLLTEGAARALLAGKVGLALSGGGFRAALFHAGVLARLAELDLLRHVEVLSCVSGGSILGALYYLELRKELEARPDGTSPEGGGSEMTRHRYIEVVRRVHERLETALRRDIRTAAMLRSLPRLLSDRTLLTGRLIDEALYGGPGRPGPLMRELRIQPAGEAADFNPKLHNWRREAKVPILILNATTLNTGHNWQFTASWMGEAPTCIEPAIDASERLRRLYYETDAPAPHRDMPLSTAVAASAAVPGLFRPITLAKLYQGRPVVRLSDGGVHDNQGVFGLMEQDCSVMLVSDGSGQLPARASPPFLAVGVLQRSTNILMDAVRRNAYRILALRRRTRRLRDLRYVHLKMGLPTEDVTWLGGAKTLGDAIPETRARAVLNERAQRALAAIRTDLDNFSANECHGLMYAGYRLTEYNLDGRLFALARPDAPRVEWSFGQAADWMRDKGSLPEDIARELECGQYRFFRRVRLRWPGGSRA
ncbi:hypothetical protein E2C06_25525 [Dankookia rubra]|uniref:PNPLA domain-containing protein n=1 Tax=Dankookia rubra TaxID=1442381 RepID=A0A4R5QAJ1_9PROT|nr:patatin-like phospholipase family protein [Dankookia rubra]TDH59806.1 hypothetical protein E2C06_25525 [Dankookia rubra]